VALDFHRFYKPDPENYSAIRNLIDYLDLYRRNIAYLDPNRIVLVFVLTALPLLAHLRSLAPKRRSLLMIALFLLPLAVLLPARRFQLVAFVVLYLSAVETMAVWFSTQVARYGQMLRGAAFLVLIALFVQRVQYAHEARIPSLVREHSWIEVKPYLTVRAMEESVYTRYPGWPAVVWLEANLPKKKRVLVTGHMMLSSMADVRLLNNMHIHGENALVIMTEDQGVELDQLLDILRGWDIGAIHTETAFDRNPVLQELHDGWLDRVLDANGYTLYVLREERR
jgi:hypothetical protein